MRDSGREIRAGTCVLWVLLILIPIFLFLISFAMGQYPISVGDLLRTLYDQFTNSQLIQDENMEIVLFRIRLPRVCCALLIGGGLAVAGAAYQGMFKNPMVSPDILGASAGAGFGAALALFLSMSVASVQLFAFVFGLLAVLLAVNINRGIRCSPILGLVLGGMLVSNMFSALTSGIKFLADSDDKLPAITFWLMGSLASIEAKDLWRILPAYLISLGILFHLRWKLNVLSFGEEEARAMGIRPERVRAGVIVASTLITSSSVAVCGMIGWVGLVIPHLARMMAGPDYRRLLPVCTVLGASFLLLVDDICRCAWSVELPIGVLTSIIGVPFFLVVFRMNQKGGML